jgi:hypothetical protein
MRPDPRHVLVLATIFLSLGCAVMHKVQLGDVEAAGSHRTTPISIKVSETTVNLREIAGIAKAVGAANKSRGLSGAGRAVEAYTALFQMGPKTGTPVYNEFYAHEIAQMLQQQCPHGRVQNIISLRETRAYPIVKGEIVRIDGECAQ